MPAPHVEDQVDAYVLGALEPDERRSVEEHLAGCVSCQALAENSRELADQLLYVRPPSTPPPELRARILARIASEPQDAHPADAQASTAPAPHPMAPEIEALVRPPTPWQRLTRTLFGAPAEEEAVDQLARELMNDPQCIIWPVGGTGEAPGASARLVGTPAREEAVLITTGLRPSARGQAYQVWFLSGGQPVPNALFRVGRSGHVARVVRAPAPLREYDTVAVTPEPAAGSPGPTGPIVLAGGLTH